MNLVLFINGNLGLKILGHLVEDPDYNIIAVILNSEKKRAVNYVEEVNRVLTNQNYVSQVVLWNGSNIQLEEIGKSLEPPIYGVSALFGHILPQGLISKFKGGILNLHPSLLPIGRGANPISWSIINKQPQGITLHLINQQLDAGDIVFQKEIKSSIEMTAGEIYENSINELFNVFSIYFTKWVNGEVSPYPQPPSEATLHKSGDFNALRKITENEFGSFGDFIRRIQASTFSNARYPLFEDSMGKIWEVELKITNPRNQD